MTGSLVTVEESQPLVSVIIPVYNRLQYIEQAIQSALNQSYSRLQVIVVDDGSTLDPSPAVSAYRDRILFLHKTNGGQASARNFGVAQADGEYLLFLDDDDVLEPTAVEALVRALQDHPESTWAAGQFANIDSDGRAIDIKHRCQYQSGDIYPQMIHENLIGAPSSVLVSTSAFRKLGGFDESRAYIMAEDYDLWLSLAQHSPLVAIDLKVTNYRLHQTNVTGGQWARHFDAIIGILRKHRETGRPGFDFAFKQSIAEQFRQMGDEFYVSGEMGAARRRWWQALVFNPRIFGPRLAGRLLKSCLPQSLLRRLREKARLRTHMN